MLTVPCSGTSSGGTERSCWYGVVVGLEGAHCLVCKTVQSSIFVTCWYLWLTGYFTWDPVKKAAAKAGCRNRYRALRLSWNAVLAKWFSKEGRVFGALGWALTDGWLEGAGWSCWSRQLWAASLCSVATATPACANPAWNWALSCCCSQPGTVKQVLILLYRDAPGRKQKQFRSWAESWLSGVWLVGDLAPSLRVRAGQDQQHFPGIGGRNSMQPVVLEAGLCTFSSDCFPGVAHSWDWVNKLQISFISSCER